MAVALLSDCPGSLLICNGYKDTAYMELVRCADGGTIILTGTPLHALPESAVTAHTMATFSVTWA